MKEPVGLLIAAARRKMKRAVHERVAPHGLTTQQFWALVNIDEAFGGWPNATKTHFIDGATFW